jgi:hypothetical protein
MAVNRRAGLLALVIAAAALGALWRVGPPAPPLYDGLCTPEPYRFVGASPPPLSAAKMYPAVAPGAFQTSQVTTDDNVPQDGENPAQAQVLMTDGTFVSPTPFTLSITPMKPSGVLPSDGTVDGNLYRIVATTTTGMRLNPVDAQHGITLLLRGTGMNPARTMERFDGHKWSSLRTLLAGCGDTFEAVTPSLGDFALVVPKSAPPPSGGGIPAAPIVIGLIVVVFAVLLLLIRLNRSRGALSR